ncbi:hypothetical protein [Antrihabitans cavernicola]|uniref:Uncharacterized protein n=1 Tax=Antrihabitans cavernicola TaxID=2495913 RepID=A0A5A7S1W9_9NOCA|nr:hypothetical protein [Spelaeibacter cavernicola]KAA0017655.1 hypothetical protein FOY51_24740 [Spelaeibacter cavernicola]
MASPDAARELRIDFPGMVRGSVKHLSWADWFARFDTAGLAFRFLDKTLTDGGSNFYHLVAAQ